MADTKAAAGLTVQQWDDKFFMESLSENRFAGEMGTSESSIIQVKEDLSKKKGDTVTFALVNRLKGAEVNEGGTLEGNEESLDSRSFPVKIRQRRNGVAVRDFEEQISAIGLRKAAKAVLKDWSMENTRDQVITALESVDGRSYATATETQKDTWLSNNTDRILFGDAKGNRAGNDHSASLLAVTAGMTFGTAELKLMKRMARAADPKIRPIRDTQAKNGKLYYVVYAETNLFRDFSNDAEIKDAQKNVSLKAENSRLFDGGDLLWDGMIIKEVEDFNTISGAGAGGIDIGRAMLVGAQAVAYAIARRWKSAEESFDYGDKKGCAIGEMGGFAKMQFGTGADPETDDLVDPKDHGVLTAYFASVPDA